jgi:6-phosphogluconolactonase (cycloisomerase 2 family)
MLMFTIRNNGKPLQSGKQQIEASLLKRAKRTLNSFKLIMAALLSIIFSSPSVMAEITFVETHLDASTPASLVNATDTIISPDGKNVYVVSWGSSSLSVFSRDVVTGNLTFIEELIDGQGGVTGLQTLFGIDISPDGSYIYTIAGGGSDQVISVFNRNSSTGILTLTAEYREGDDDGSGNIINGLSCALDLVVSPDGKNVYGIGTGGTGTLLVFNRDTITGTLTYSTVFTDGVDSIEGLSTSCSPNAGPINSIAISSDGAYLYNAASIDHSITMWNRDTETGALTYGETLSDGNADFDGLQGVTSLIISPDDTNIYVSGQGEHKIGVYSRNLSTGSLTFVEVQTDEIDNVNNLAGVRSLAISQDGMFVFASAINDHSISLFERNPSTGALTYSDDATDGLDGVDGLNQVSGMVVSPENTHLYAAAQADAAITVFSLPRPGIDLSTKNGVFNESDTALTLDNSLRLYDANSVNLTGGSVTISSGFIDGDILSATEAGSITTSYDAQTGILTLSGTDTLQTFQTVLRSVTFLKLGDDPTLGGNSVSRSIDFQITDDTDVSSVPATFTLAVNSENDSPVNTTPSDQSINSNETLTFSNSNAISIADIDLGSNDIEIALIITNGVVSLSETANLVFITGDGVDDASMVFRGTIININNALDGLTFTPDLDFIGIANIQILTSNINDTSTEGAPTDDDTLTIKVGTENASAEDIPTDTGGSIGWLMLLILGLLARCRK